MDGADRRSGEANADANAADPNRLVPIDLPAETDQSFVRRMHTTRRRARPRCRLALVREWRLPPRQWLAVDLGKPQNWPASASPGRRKARRPVQGPKARRTARRGPPSRIKPGPNWPQVRQHHFRRVLRNAAVRRRQRPYLKGPSRGLSPGCWGGLYRSWRWLGSRMCPRHRSKAAAGPRLYGGSSTRRYEPPAATSLTISRPAGGHSPTPTSLAASPPGGEVFVGIDPDGSLGRRVPGQGAVADRFNRSRKADRIRFAKMDHPAASLGRRRARSTSAPPFFSAYTDEDGDGVADTPRTYHRHLGAQRRLTARGVGSTTTASAWSRRLDLHCDGDFRLAGPLANAAPRLPSRVGRHPSVRPTVGLESTGHHTRSIIHARFDPFLNVFHPRQHDDGDGWNDRLAYDASPPDHYGYRASTHFPGEWSAIA